MIPPGRGLRYPESDNMDQILARDFADFEEFAETIGGWRLRLQQLDRGRFSASLLQVGAGPVLFSEGRTGRKLHQTGEVPPGFTFALLARQNLGAQLRGRDVGSDRLMIFPPGGELDVVSGSDFHVFTVSVDPGHFRSVAAGLGFEEILEAMNRDTAPRLDPAAAGELRATLHRVSASRRLGARDLTGSIVRTLALSRGDDVANRQRSLDSVITRVEQVLAKHARHSLTVRDLSGATSVTERTLRRAIQARYGMSPKSLLRARRLNGARRSLRSGRPGRTSVTQVALEWGFTHFGRFSGDYSALFGELPSETLAARPRG